MPATRTKDPIAELNADLAKLEKKLGVTSVMRPASVEPPVRRLPFINPHMNYATEGGAPWNRIVTLYGDESTGKSLCAYELCAQAQALPDSAERALKPRIGYHRAHGHTVIVERLEDELEWIMQTFPEGARCAWDDIEGQFDPKRAAQVGVDIDALYVSDLNIIEDIGQALPLWYKHFDLTVLDSTSAATSQLRLKHDSGKSLMGTDARQWKEVLRDSKTYFGPAKNESGRSNMLILIHQMSTNLRTGGSQPVAGRYLKFESSLAIRFAAGRFLYDVDGVLREDKPSGSDERAMTGTREADGREVFAKIEKSRTCRPFRQGAMHFDYRTLRYTPLAELSSSAQFFGIIEKSGSWFKVSGEEKNLGQGEKSVYARLADDEGLRNRIYARLLDYTQEK